MDPQGPADEWAADLIRDLQQEFPADAKPSAVGDPTGANIISLEDRIRAAGFNLAAPRQPISFANIPHRRWLYGVDLVRGEMTVLASPGGVGKSSLTLAIAASVATGRSLLGQQLYGDGLKALYINAEDSRTEMLRRLHALSIQHGFGEADLLRLTLLGADDWQVQRLSFIRADRGASLLDENGVATLDMLIEEAGAAIVVLDPLVALCGGGNMNDNAAMSSVMRGIKRLATSRDCAVLIAHHTRKGGDLLNAEAVGGASAIVNLARRALMLSPMSQEEARTLCVPPSERARYFRLVSAKSNLAPPTTGSEWYELRSVELPNAEPPTYPTGDRVQAIVRVALPHVGSRSTGSDDPAIRRAILELVDAGKKVDGVRVPYSPSTSGANNIRSLTEDAITAVRAVVGPTMPQEDLAAVVERTIADLKKVGAIVEHEILSGRFRRGRGLDVDWNSTPWAAERDASATEQPSAPESHDLQEAA